MLRLASDADVHGGIIRGLRRRLPEIDLVRAQDALSEGTPDPEVLAWAAAQGRVQITNDRNTVVGFAYQRVAAGELMPGLIATTNEQSIGSAIDPGDCRTGFRLTVPRFFGGRPGRRRDITRPCRGAPLPDRRASQATEQQRQQPEAIRGGERRLAPPTSRSARRPPPCGTLTGSPAAQCRRSSARAPAVA